MTFAKRLVAGTLVVLFFTVSILVWSAERSLRGDLEADIARTLERDGRLVREALPTDSLTWGAVVRRLATDDSHEIELVDSTGRIRASSEIADGDLIETVRGFGYRFRGAERGSRRG